MWKFVVLFCCIADVLGDGSRVVNITQGPVRGRLLPGGGVYGFYNIPYASAPTGADRYKAPRPPPTWLTTFEAEDRKIMCPQRFASGTMNIQEDCLVVNVFIPDTEETNLPVHVEHPGRLPCGTEAAPGNAGLKDMVALLRWVNTNIASFGGNPDDVTLSACSAGSGSLDFLTVSSLTNGLFKKVIQESGTVIGAVAAQVDPIQNARNYAAVLNFDNVNDLNSLEEFYKNVSIQQLISRTDAIINNEGVTSRFGPCVERDNGQEIFLSDAPMNILSQGNYTKVPRIYGFTNMDGSVRFSVFDTWKEMMNEKFSDFLPSELHFDSEEVKEQVAERVKQFYFGDNPVSEHNFLSYIYYNTDVLFAYPMLKTLSTRVGALEDSIYLFEYSFVDENSPVYPLTDEVGARHCSQERIVSDGDLTGATEEYKRMQEIMREYWMNFISNGYPSSSDPSLPTWRPANAQRSPHMSLGRDIVLKESSPIPERAALWDEIFEEYFRGPIIDTNPAPLPPPVWMSPLDAVNRNIRCPQPNVLEHTQEDCLVVNLFVPDTTDTNLSVLVFIHGGAFQNGHGLSAQYKELVQTKKLIAVSFNYRIGVHGFLCLGTEGAPGNAGIKDQIALLRWLNSNIARFGGNPDDVTLIACSAGLGSVDALTLSSATKGLFQKAIMESGSSTGAVGVVIDPIQNAKELR
ncbi:unnamed protein product [Spodoptera exigua]|nr:unnamed protein product [Spodoptera exigua]